ncbi:diguanylate cyclase [bacterium BFN5]|nr:diguanylate cyclase [bacterium BFN5]
MKPVRSSALKVAASYAVVGTLWIILSDLIVGYLVTDLVLRGKLEVIKGWLFIAITAAVLYYLIRSNHHTLTAREKSLHKQNEEIAATYEELYAAEEELRHQFDELLCQESIINRRNECLAALHEAALILMQERTVDDLLQNVVRKMMALSGAQYGYIYLLDESSQVMCPNVVEGFPADSVHHSVRRDEGIIGKVWTSENMVIIPNYHDWEGRLHGSNYELLRAGVGLPLKVGDKVVGVFSMNYTVEHIIDEEERRTLESFAELASIALASAHLHEALQRSQSRNQALIEALPDLILRFDQQGTLLEFENGSDFRAPLIDMTPHIGHNVEAFLPAAIAQQYKENLQRSFSTKTTQYFEYDIEMDGKVKWREARMMVCGTGDAIAIVRDITERVEMDRKLKYLGLYDRVTGLYNRASFEEALDHINASGQYPVSIIVCDIDGLKLVNDTLGHQAGDELLINAARLIQECFHSKDLVARVGGDEFAVVVFDQDSQAIEKLCHNLRQRVKQFREENTQIPISISVGLGDRLSPEQDMRDVFKAADDNMYREKLHSSQSTRSAIVHTLAKAMEVRDFVTDGHADRLQDLVVELALAAGVTESKLSDLRLLGRFHDIGKVGIPDHILFKPGRLSDDEFEVMKRHCEIGYRVAQASAELAPIADWILKHQEWWNGNGYPLGLQGDDIPIACRILAIVDAYDAMTNDRPYRQAMTQDEAVAELGRCAGTQFDPDLVQVFIKLVILQNKKA